MLCVFWCYSSSFSSFFSYLGHVNEIWHTSLYIFSVKLHYTLENVILVKLVLDVGEKITPKVKIIWLHNFLVFLVIFFSFFLLFLKVFLFLMISYLVGGIISLGLLLSFLEVLSFSSYVNMKLKWLFNIRIYIGILNLLLNNSLLIILPFPFML